MCYIHLVHSSEREEVLRVVRNLCFSQGGYITVQDYLEHRETYDSSLPEAMDLHAEFGAWPTLIKEAVESSSICITQECQETRRYFKGE